MFKYNGPMKMRSCKHGFVLRFLLGALALCAGYPAYVRADEWTNRFQDPPASAGMTVYWIWFGPAITQEGIDRDLANMKAARISGATILTVYPLSDNDEPKGVRNLRFLSEEFLQQIAYAAMRAKE